MPDLLSIINEGQFQLSLIHCFYGICGYVMGLLQFLENNIYNKQIKKEKDGFLTLRSLLQKLGLIWT